MNGFNYTPTLLGEDISIRPLRENDFNGLYKCASDKKIWEGHPATDRYKREQFEYWFHGAIGSQSTIVISDSLTNEIIGSSRYYIEDSSPNDISIGHTFLSCKYWGGVTNSQLKQLMLNYAFKHFNNVWFHIALSNIRSQKATQKIGAKFSHEGISKLTGKPELWKFYKVEKGAYIRAF